MVPHRHAAVGDRHLYRLARRAPRDGVLEQVDDRPVEPVRRPRTRVCSSSASNARSGAWRRTRSTARRPAGPVGRPRARRRARRPSRSSTRSLTSAVSSSSWPRRRSTGRWRAPPPVSPRARASTSMFVRMLVSGVRSSCDASATSWRWAPADRSSDASIALKSPQADRARRRAGRLRSVARGRRSGRRPRLPPSAADRPERRRAPPQAEHGGARHAGECDRDQDDRRRQASRPPPSPAARRARPSPVRFAGRTRARVSRPTSVSSERACRRPTRLRGPPPDRDRRSTQAERLERSSVAVTIWTLVPESPSGGGRKTGHEPGAGARSTASPARSRSASSTWPYSTSRMTGTPRRRRGNGDRHCQCGRQRDPGPEAHGSRRA